VSCLVIIYSSGRHEKNYHCIVKKVFYDDSSIATNIESSGAGLNDQDATQTAMHRR